MRSLVLRPEPPPPPPPPVRSPPPPIPLAIRLIGRSNCLLGWLEIAAALAWRWIGLRFFHESDMQTSLLGLLAVRLSWGPLVSGILWVLTGSALARGWRWGLIGTIGALLLSAASAIRGLVAWRSLGWNGAALGYAVAMLVIIAVAWPRRKLKRPA